ncbi:hypothetical protein [Dactylosporangium sp. NPDC005555]|uniref:hypothetical protein n=1 Tax=Dactylosporangium sp. NPDC005555 TaxID=3154889 RepID=UPI00339DE2B8
MANTDNRHGVPRVDRSVDIDTVRDEAERIAVPDFDYIGQPIDAIVDGLTGHSHDRDEDTEETTVE